MAREGMVPASLRATLARWSQGEEGEPDRPKFLYINPTGANPTGSLLPEDRRREIYELCCQYNLLLLEDDPYYFLQFGAKDQRPPSFLTLDTEGRVIRWLPSPGTTARFDSFSKVLSSGIRLGFVTGPKELIQRIVLHMQVSVLHASSLSQVPPSPLTPTGGNCQPPGAVGPARLLCPCG